MDSLAISREADRAGRLLDRLDDPAEEAHGVGAVDDPVVVRERQRQQLPRLELVRTRHTDSMMPRETPRIATSGQLTIGVKYVPPMPPRLEIVMPPPLISSSVSLRLRAFSASWCTSTAISVMFF